MTLLTKKLYFRIANKILTQLFKTTAGNIHIIHQILSTYRYLSPEKDSKFCFNF